MATVKRLEALDALRGLAILGMAWSGMLPDTLPAWMFHAQLPPPDHVFNPELPGLTWVDLVFPFFLFALGAAIPFAIGTRLDKGQTNWQIAKDIGIRGVLLAAFAIFGQHLRPGAMATNPGTNEWLLALLGFVLLFLMFVRWPKSIPTGVQRLGTGVGWVSATLLIALHKYPDNTGFANYRMDIILMVLANVAVSGGLIWLFTRSRPGLRLAIIAIVSAIFLGAQEKTGLARQIWDFTPLQFFDLDHWAYGRFVPVLYHFEYHKYLLIVLPATFIGEALQKMDSDKHPQNLGMPILGVAMSAIACYGLMSRVVELTSLVLVTLGIFGLWLAQRLKSEAVIQTLRIGITLLIVGLLVEPLAGGIKKDHPTLSYFLVTGGLASYALVGLVCLNAKFKNGLMKLLSDCGANPILGYVVITNLVMGVFGLLQWESFVGTHLENPWAQAICDGLLKTFLVLLITAWFTRKKLFLRA